MFDSAVSHTAVPMSEFDSAVSHTAVPMSVFDSAVSLTAVPIFNSVLVMSECWQKILKGRPPWYVTHIVRKKNILFEHQKTLGKESFSQNVIEVNLGVDSKNLWAAEEWYMSER